MLNKGKPLNKSWESECRNARYAQHQNEICYAISLKWVSDSTQYCIVTPASNLVWENLTIFAIDNLVQSVTHTFRTMFLLRVIHILRIHLFYKNASNYSKSILYKTRIPLTRSFITVFSKQIHSFLLDYRIGAQWESFVNIDFIFMILTLTYNVC